MNYTIYDPSTGKITGTVTGSSESALNLNLVGKTYITGSYDSTKYYILNGTPTAIDSDPSTNSLKYSFDWNTKTWNIDIAKTTSLMRAKRNSFLSSVDRVNPLWYASLTADQQAELQAYRTALLNVPQQSGFPTNITWPTKPTWLS